MNILNLFDYEAEKLLQQTDRLQEAMNHLQYEGKAFRSKNLKTARRIIKGLEVPLKKHCLLQEKIIFPFLQVHIPKRESMIRFLSSDHKDICKNKERLRLSLQQLFKDYKSAASKVQIIGTYLICLLRLHLELEKESIRKVIITELRRDEKEEVERRIAKLFPKMWKMKG